MDDQVNKIIAEQMKILPKDVKEAIISVDYKTQLQEITKRQMLLIDQAGKLEMETTLVMIGLEPLADYVANLQRELNIPLMKAKEIALDISEHIFKPIRESLQKMNEESMEEEGTADKEIERAQIESETDSQNNLDREQILDEIENPVPNRPSLQQNPMGQSPAVNTSGQLETKPNQGLEIRPVQNIEIRPSQNLIEDKMKNSTIVSEQIIHAVPETKLPEVKKKPYSGIDPYKEPLN